MLASHYTDVIMGVIASQITSLTIVYSTVYSDADQRKHQSSASLAFVRGIHRGPVNSLHKWPVTRKMFPFDDDIMFSAAICSVMLLPHRWWPSCLLYSIAVDNGVILNVHSHQVMVLTSKRCIYVYYYIATDNSAWHDDVIKWKHLTRYWPFAKGNQRPVTRSFDDFFDLRLNKQLSEQSRRP